MDSSEQIDFDRSVFIHCPVDDDYKPMLKCIIYTLVSLKLIPRFALERSDAAEVRLSKIKELIEACKLSIHDLSRSKSKRKTSTQG